MLSKEAKSIIRNKSGQIAVTPDCQVQALSWGSWTFGWKLGFDVLAGGGLEIILMPRFPTNRWSLPQIADPTAPGYITALAGANTAVSVDILRWPLMQKPHGATVHIIQVGVGGRTMKKGEVIEVTYGDRRGGSLGTQVQSCAREVSFPIFVSSGQQPKFLERFTSWNRATDVATLCEKADFNPSLRVVGAKASSFHLAAPMEVEPGKCFDVRLSVLDSVCNAATGYKAKAQISTTDKKAKCPSSIAITGTVAKISKVVLNSLGFHRLYAIDPHRGICGVSNPIRVKKQAKNIYWGELHGHSELSDGNGTPDEHYSYARDVALLDFAGLCDHDRHLEKYPNRWAFSAEKVQEYSQPGRFIAMLSYEGRLRNADGSEAFGDINVYYGQDEEDMLDPFTVPLEPKTVQDKEVLLIPHTSLYGIPTMMGTHWKYLKSIPAQIMPLVEIFLTHGNSEYYNCPRHLLWQMKGSSVLEALKKGFRLGFIGSSDYHEVLTGCLLRIQDTPRTLNNAHMQARCGLAAMRAEKLTRADIYQAMKARRTYATSGIRAYVDFSINGHNMGTEFTVSSAKHPRKLNIAVAAPERIEKLEVIRNGKVIADLADGNWFVQTTITDKQPIPKGAFYYLRATTERTDFAWSSPIWVDIRKAH